MYKDKKHIFYEINPRFFKDSNGDGVGDIKGLTSKFEYFNHLGINTIILQEILATNSTKEQVSYTEIDSKIGNVNDIIKFISLAKKHKIKVIIEINIGTIKKNNNWFAANSDDESNEFYNVINLKPKKENDNIDYNYSDENKKYYICDSTTQEIPLNWKSQTVFNNFLKVIKFWQNIGINGFVFEKFEYLEDESKTEILNKKTFDEIKKLYHSIKKMNNDLIVIGRSNLIKINNATKYTKNKNKIFDFFISTKIPMLGIFKKYGINYKGRFFPKLYLFFTRKYFKNENNIISFNSKEIGKAISRWTNDGEYIKESAKALAILLMINNASPLIYFGDEIGMPNIGLNKNSDFQTPDIDEKKRIALSQKITENEFYEAHILNNPINARSLMIWNQNKNGGFSFADKTITPVSNILNDINVENQYKDKTSILNFYRKLIQIINYSSFSEIIKKGKIKVYFILPGIIKYTIKSKKTYLDIVVNLTGSTKINILKDWKGKIILSTYENKSYYEIPVALGPYEGIVISRQSPEYIKSTQQIRIKRIKKRKQNELAKIIAKKVAKKEEEKVILETKKKEEEIINTKIKKVQDKEKKEWFKKSQKDEKESENEQDLDFLEEEIIDNEEISKKENDILDTNDLNTKKRKWFQIFKKSQKDEKESENEQDLDFLEEDIQNETENTLTSSIESDIFGKKNLNTQKDEKESENEQDLDFLEEEIIDNEEISKKENDILDTNDLNTKKRKWFQIFKKSQKDEKESENKEEIQSDNNDLNDLKKSMKIEKDIENSHLDEATKLKENEVAKTILLEDTTNLDELLDLEKNKKKK